MQAKSFKPSKEMTFTTVQADCERLVKHCRTSNDAVITLDLSDVTHCDSAGLALLIEAKRLSKGRNKAYKIEGLPQTVHALAEFYGLDSILNC